MAFRKWPKSNDSLKAKARWDRRNMTTVGTKLNREKIAAFEDACEAYGITRYEALRRFCQAVILRPETLERLKWQRGPRRAK